MCFPTVGMKNSEEFVEKGAGVRGGGKKKNKSTDLKVSQEKGMALKLPEV